MQSLEPNLQVTNEPRRSSVGAPDYIVTRANVPLGYMEAKDLGEDLRKAERSEQLKRYRGAGSGSIIGDKREIVAVQKEPQTDLVHLLRLGKR